MNYTFNQFILEKYENQLIYHFTSIVSALNMLENRY